MDAFVGVLRQAQAALRGLRRHGALAWSDQGALFACDLGTVGEDDPSYARPSASQECELSAHRTSALPRSVRDLDAHAQVAVWRIAYCALQRERARR